MKNVNLELRDATEADFDFLYRLCVLTSVMPKHGTRRGN